MKSFQEEIRYQFKALDHYPILFISALTKKRIHRVLEVAWEVYEKAQKKISTKHLNKILEIFILELHAIKPIKLLLNKDSFNNIGDLLYSKSFPLASSKISSSGLYNKALVIDSLCLCPPESFMPLSPIIVSKPFF